MIKKWKGNEKELYESLSEDEKKYFTADGEEYIPITTINNELDAEEFQKKSPENWGLRSDGSIAILDHNCIHKKIRAKCPKFLKAK